MGDSLALLLPEILECCNQPFPDLEGSRHVTGTGLATRAASRQWLEYSGGYERCPDQNAYPRPWKPCGTKTHHERIFPPPSIRL